MGRLFFVAFWEGDSSLHHKGTVPFHFKQHEARESPLVMTIPLIFLAIFSVLGGFIGIPHFLYPQEAPEGPNKRVAVISSIISILGLGFSYIIYGKRAQSDPLATKLGGFYTALKNKFYFDIVYGWYVDNIQQNLGLFLSRFEKEFIVSLCVGGLTNLARSGGKTFRYLQNGIVQFYAMVFVLGAISLFLFLMLNKYSSF
jgi:NADH-quinone oxidoreductase subunit L